MRKSLTQAELLTRVANEKEYLLSRLRQSRERYLQTVSGVPGELSRVRPGDGAWSVLDCAEHVAIAEQLMFRSVEKRRPTAASPDVAKDALIQTVGLDRTRKFSAPEPARPAGRYATLEEAVVAFRAAREVTISFVNQASEDLRASTALHPIAGLIDAYQELLLMALHCERHAAQIEEISRHWGNQQRIAER